VKLFGVSFNCGNKNSQKKENFLVLNVEMKIKEFSIVEEMNEFHLGSKILK
jgi:hypothetical protein